VLAHTIQHVKIDRRVMNGARLDTVYEHYQKVFWLPPHRPEGANFVPGAGDLNPSVVFVGEAPGEEEDKLQIPFVGRSGRLLNRMLSLAEMPVSIGRHGGAWVTNVVKYRPVGNKMTQEVMVPAKYYIEQEINILNPRVVVTLGRWSTSVWFLDPFSMTQIAGQRFAKQDRIVVPMLHPSYVLRKQNKKVESAYRQDFENLKKILIDSLST
jgi:uracil-DNA glycosylase